MKTFSDAADDGTRSTKEAQAGNSIHEELSKYHALAVQRLTARGPGRYFGSQVLLKPPSWLRYTCSRRLR